MTVSSVFFAQQFIPVQGIVNARDLGGYAVQDGRRVRDGLLLRSAHLAEATDVDLQYLSQLPTAAVIDMRKEDEKKGKVDRIDREYGSLDAYLHGPMGLTDEDIQTLRARYLE